MKNRQNRQKKAQPLPVLFICISVLPAVILTLMFTIWPTVQALYLSFTNATSLGLNNKFVWLDNYIYMFHDKSFIQALKNTAKLMAVVPVITIFCSLVLAFVLNQCKLKERVLYRTIFYFPNIVSLTVVGIIWSFVFHPNVGIINKILGAVGLESLQRSWLGDSKTALWCIAFTLLWQAAGYYMVMHIAAMDGISPEIYESATLDGASAWRKLVSITMPLMKDIIGMEHLRISVDIAGLWLRRRPEEKLDKEFTYGSQHHQGSLGLQWHRAPRRGVSGCGSGSTRPARSACFLHLWP